MNELVITKKDLPISWKPRSIALVKLYDFWVKMVYENAEMKSQRFDIFI